MEEKPLYQYHRAKAVNGVKLRVGRSRFSSQCKAESLPYGCGGARLSHHRMRLRHWAELFLRLYFASRTFINGGNGKTWSVRFSETLSWLNLGACASIHPVAELFSAELHPWHRRDWNVGA